MALSRRRALPKCVVVFALVCGHATSYESGYFRYGTLSWQQTKIESDGITVKFTLKTAWARAMFSRREGDVPWGNCITCSVPATDAKRQCDNEPVSKVQQSSCFLPVVGDWVALHDAVDTTLGQSATPGGILPWVETTFSFGDNPSRPLTGARDSTASNYRPKCKNPADPAFGKCIEGFVVDSFAVDADAMPTPEENARDIVYVVSDIVYKYPRQTRSFLAEFTGCCRQSSQIVNNANGAWQLRAYVSITDDPLVMDTGTAASPVIEHIPVIHVIYGQALDFSVHAYDAADRPVKFRLGDSSEFGVDLSQGSQGQVSQPPYANAMEATINADTGVVTFPATEKTSYPDTYFNLVVVATTLGPCQGYVSTSLSRRCDTPEGRPQTQKVTAILDFLVRVVYAGYSGIGALSSCANVDSGLPPGSKQCNSAPQISTPDLLLKFICGEAGWFQVTATDGLADVSVSGSDPNATNVPQRPRGIFVIRHRQRVSVSWTNYTLGLCSVASSPPVRCVDDRDCAVRGRGNCTRTQFVPSFPQGDDRLYYPGNRGITGVANSSVARANWSWTPACEPKDASRANSMYAYVGRHRLGMFAPCFVGVDEGGRQEKQGKLSSPPSCVTIAVLRCTKPTLQLRRADRPPSRISGGAPVWSVAVSTNLTLTFAATDDPQSRRISVYHHSAHGIPAVGALWLPQQCTGNAAQLISCNPVERAFFFEAALVHVGAQITVCVEAVNDQIECPRYRKNPAAANQSFGVHISPPPPPPQSSLSSATTIATSQASEAFCFLLEVKGPELEFVTPTPAENAEVVTYAGCPLTLTLAAEDRANQFDLQIEPRTSEFELPPGLTLSNASCGLRAGMPPPAIVAAGVGSCTAVSRSLSWKPNRKQTGQTHQMCFELATSVAVSATRCFSLHVGKCRYCVQAGESMKEIAQSVFSDWLQLWAANTDMRNPYDLRHHQLINIGAIYRAKNDENLAGLAQRFRADIRSLMVANPDIQTKEEKLRDHQPICILPGTCTSADSTLLGGFSMGT